MNCDPVEFALAQDASVRQLLRPIADPLQLPGVTEICINEPGIVHYERDAIWHEEACPDLSYRQCKALATAVGALMAQSIDDVNTILSATLGTGERIHVVLPPTCPTGTVSITLRVPAAARRTLREYGEAGFFARIRPDNSAIPDEDLALLELKRSDRYEEFLRACVLARKNIGIVGDTGSGKTTFMKTLCQEIPASERLITIEDARELFLDGHRNKVHLVYATHGRAAVDSSDLIRSTLRMRPDRVLPAELRGAEAFDFLDLLTTGHSGSITSWHAQSTEVAFERFALMCTKHPHAGSYTHASLMRLLRMTLDVIVHVRRCGTQRHISSIHFDPSSKLSMKRHNEDHCHPQGIAA